jgi:hypothetical protein
VRSASAISLGLDAFLTGEPAEHVMAEAREARVHFIAGGHYATETFGARRLGELVAERFAVEHRFNDVPNPICPRSLRVFRCAVATSQYPHRYARKATRRIWYMAIHLTPTELGREAGMHRQEVIRKCIELNVPIFQGRIDKTLFLNSLKAQKKQPAKA